MATSDEKRKFNYFKLIDEARAQVKKDKLLPSWIPIRLIGRWKKGAFEQSVSTEFYSIDRSVRTFNQDGECFGEYAYTTYAQVYTRCNGTYQVFLALDEKTLLELEILSKKIITAAMRDLALDNIQPDVLKELVKELVKANPLLKSVPFFGSALDGLDQAKLLEQFSDIEDRMIRLQKEIAAARKLAGTVICEFNIIDAFKGAEAVEIDRFVQTFAVECDKFISSQPEGVRSIPFNLGSIMSGGDFTEKVNRMFDPETGEKDEAKRKDALKKCVIAEELKDAKRRKERKSLDSRTQRFGIFDVDVNTGLNVGTAFDVFPTGAIFDGDVTYLPEPIDGEIAVSPTQRYTLGGDLVLQVDPKLIRDMLVEGLDVRTTFRPMTISVEPMPPRTPLATTLQIVPSDTARREKPELSAAP